MASTLTTDQTRFMLHEIGKALGLPLSPIIEAIQDLNLRGRMIGGGRYWTREEVQRIEKWLSDRAG